MKKTLLICFLALLCLAGSPPSAQSKVAESPGADLLHRFAGPTVSPHSGDTNRGGPVSRPDTFCNDVFKTRHGEDRNSTVGEDLSVAIPSLGYVIARQVTRREESEWPWQSHPLKQNPIDETSTSAQKPPLAVTTLIEKTAALRTSAPAMAGRRSDVSSLPSFSSLVDQYLDPGAGEETLRLQPAPVTVWADTLSSTNRENQAYLYLELDGGPTESTYQTHLWKRIGTAGFSPESAQTIISEVSPRDFFRGMLPSVTGSLDIQTGILESPTYLAVSSKGGFLLNPFLVFPGDSALIRVNQQSGKIQFSGPARNELLLQYQLQQALENEGFTVHQLVTVSDKQKYLTNNGNQEKIESGQRKFGRQVVVLQKGEEELAWLDHQFKASNFPQSIGRMVAAHQGCIQDERLQGYQADILGKFFANYCRQLTRVIPDLTEKSHPQAEKLITQLELKFDSIQENHWHLSGVVEFWLALSDAKMNLQSRNPLDWIGELETGYPRDLLVEHYFYSKGKSIENLDAQLETGLALVEDPRVKAKLSHIKATRSLGSPILPMDLLTTEKDTVQLDKWKSQVVLVEFWLSGCGACLTRYQKILKPLEEYFSDDPRFRLVAVSVDRNESRWNSNIGTYSSAHGTNALVLPTAFEALQEYGIDSYPGFLLLGKDAQILKVSGFPNELETMIDLIKKSLDTEFSSNSQASN